MIIVVAVIFIFRLFSLQVLSDKYKSSANNNAFLYKTVYPSRGVIYDRNHNLLVYNQPSYDITVVMSEVSNLDTLDFCESLGISKAYFDKRMSVVKDYRYNLGYSRFTRQVFMSQLTAEEFAVFQEKIYRYRGFDAQRKTLRRYVYPAAAHLLGDLGEVSKSDIAKDNYYSLGDYIGKQGVERQYETYLRGEKGVEILLKDAHGRIQGRYLDGAEDIKAVSGKDITIGIDINLQMLGERLMRNKIGAIVAIEPATGEVLCMVSSPSFDPSELVGRRRGENHDSLSTKWSKPLLNRAIMGTYPPGSTFKISQALTFLQEKIITPQTQFPCTGGFVFGRLKVGCHAHSSPLDLIPAIATSCNSYFCWSYYKMIGSDKYKTPQQALTVWKDYMVEMGFGYTLGIDLPGEKRGMIPNAQYYDDIYNSSWNGLTTISNAIGQGEVTLTPLQIANLCATIANRGTYVTPHVVISIEDEKIDSAYIRKNRVSVDSLNYEYVVEGMKMSVINGTCRTARSTEYEVCGKTGTAQNRGKDHSAFTGFAPKDNPKIAIAVYVENGGFGATFGVPIGALMMEQYLNGFLSESSQFKVEEIQNRDINYDEEER